MLTTHVTQRVQWVVVAKVNRRSSCSLLCRSTLSARGTFKAQRSSTTYSIDVLACIEGLLVFKTLAHLAFCFCSTALHHGFRFPGSNNKGSLCVWEGKYKDNGKGVHYEYAC